jgi:ubiquinone/menaquinone biosynthesis C-methylase UbiE
MTTPYDEVLYPNSAYPQTHPLRLSAMATVFGAPSAPFETARVLEIACGDGANLFGMAVAAPRASFVGLDLAETPIRQGLKIVEGLGLTNLRLEARDVRDANDDLGQFDYLIAHGVYAWAPASVREALMALAGRVLSPRGLAFISYNALPGGRVRQILRDMLLSEIRLHQGDSADRLAIARLLLERMIKEWSGEDHLQAALADQARQLLKKDESVLFHDELGEVYEPQYLTEVADLGAAHGLAYLCDALPENNGPAPDPADTLSDRERIQVEQLRDFMRPKFFRTSVFQRAGAGRAPGGEDWRALRGLWGHAALRSATPKSPKPEARAFTAGPGQAFETDHPQMIGLMQSLAQAYPASIELGPWLTDAVVGEGALRLFRAQILTVLSQPFPLVSEAGHKPRAGDLARWQAAHGFTDLTGLDQSTVRISDAEALRFITLLDGQRDRASLAQAMFGEATPERLDFVNGRLRDLAHFGLLSA